MCGKHEYGRCPILRPSSGTAPAPPSREARRVIARLRKIRQVRTPKRNRRRNLRIANPPATEAENADEEVATPSRRRGTSTAINPPATPGESAQGDKKRKRTILKPSKDVEMTGPGKEYELTTDNHEVHSGSISLNGHSTSPLIS